MKGRLSIIWMWRHRPASDIDRFPERVLRGLGSPVSPRRSSLSILTNWENTVILTGVWCS